MTSSAYDSRVLIFGSGGHAVSVMDSVSGVGLYDVAGYIAPSPEGARLEIPYLGTDDDIGLLCEQGITGALMGLGYLGQGNVRKKLFGNAVRLGMTWLNVIDGYASVSERVKMGDGVFIGKAAVVNSGSLLGNATIINSGAIIEHDVCIGSFSHVAPGAVVCGDVSVGDSVFIGANSTIRNGVSICDNTIVGAGAVVLDDLLHPGTYVGAPARIARS